MAGRIAARLAELGIALPGALAPVANYVPYTVSGNLVFISGQIARIGDEFITGTLGAGLDVAAGQRAARLCALNLLARLDAACGGNLDRVSRCIKLGGFVNGATDFIDAPQIVNGASDLMVEVFGEAGRHARFAVTVAALPLGSAVEIDAIFELG